MELTPLTWMKEQPTKPGWYWWRSHRRVEPDILKVEISGDKFVIYRDQEVLEPPPGEWAGPLDPPKSMQS
ncbi:MAG: hypothetical protein ABI980_12410 [Nitrospirota bacterium]